MLLVQEIHKHWLGRNSAVKRALFLAKAKDQNVASSLAAVPAQCVNKAFIKDY